MHLDFINPRRRTSLWGWLLLLLGLAGVGGLLAWSLLELAPSVRAGEAQLQRLQSAVAAREPVLQTLSDEQLAADSTQARAVLQLLNTPWADLFAAIEGSSEQGVALLNLEPDAVRNELVLNGEARNYAALMGYYRYLQQQPMLSSVALQTHQVNQQDRDKPVRFRISAHWERAS